MHSFIYKMERKNCVNEFVLWNGELNDFQPIIPTKDVRIYEKKCINPEQLDLNGIHVRLSYFHAIRYMVSNNNDTEITGLFGEAWNLVRDYLNFTFIFLKVEGYDRVRIPRIKAQAIMTNWMKSNITDIAAPMSRLNQNQESALYFDLLPLLSTCYKLHVPSTFKSDHTWLFNIMTSDVLFIILTIIIIISSMSILIDRYMVRNKDEKNYPVALNDHFFYTFGVFVNQDSSLLRSVENRSRILTITKKMLAFLFIMMSTANLFYLMSKKQIDAPFSDLPSFFAKSSMKLVVRSTAPRLAESLSDVSPGLIRDRLELVDSVQDVDNISCQHSIATWQSEDLHRLYEYKCMKNYAPIGTCTTKREFAIYGISKTFHYRRAIHIGILKIKESGLLSIVKKHWLQPAASLQPEQYQNVNLEQVKMLFVMYLIGVVMSVIILVIEKIVEIRKHRRLGKNGHKQLRRAVQRMNI